jgi:hypothetical protein
MTPSPMRFARQVFDFLYDFLVGDAWELFVGPITGVVVALLAIQAGVPPAAAGALLVAIVVLVGAVHLALALRGSE